MNRSYLFVPGDSQRKIDRARASNADAVIIDLEDAVVPGRRDEARRLAAAAAGGQTWVRINPLDSADAEIDLEAVVPSAPAGIVLPKP
ncbi:MAG: aldolase/citrate lyase family protein, partial [Woeseiaceae bacterium]|nr:aldolase/citrate lyase family protein [Woeseiaceae bacterium]